METRRDKAIILVAILLPKTLFRVSNRVLRGPNSPSTSPSIKISSLQAEILSITHIIAKYEPKALEGKVSRTLMREKMEDPVPLMPSLRHIYKQVGSGSSTRNPSRCEM
jgi:hypothetical protein